MKIFLDIDGVMVHGIPSKKVEFENDGFYKFNENAVKALVSLVNESNEVILSTSHRFKYKKREWITIFHSRGLYFNKLSILNFDRNNRMSRKELILHWIIKKELQPSNFIIIDDDKSLNSLVEKYKSRLILTNPYLGLKSIEEIESILR